MGIAGCAPKLNAGEWQCPNDGGAPAPAPTDTVALPWSAGFEDRFCDYTEVAGNCYGDDPYTLTTEEVHNGRFAAKFVAMGDGGQTRCIRRGVLPDAAYYGAWYYIPVAPIPPGKTDPNYNRVLWNLFHFQSPDQPNLWDVSLRPDSKGDWDLFIYDPYAGRLFSGPDPSPVPIGSWFHIEFFLKRAPDATGAFALYQDDTLLVEANNLKSDYSKYTEWYVGNLGERLQPPDSTLYVDDVSIRATR
ncbi:MAG: hypothetical protein ABUL62_14870 [Myxococcales bacterium]